MQNLKNSPKSYGSECPTIETICNLTAGSTSEDEDTSDVAIKGIFFGSLLRSWAEISRINYYSSEPLDVMKSRQSIRRKSIGITPKEYSIHFLCSADQWVKTDEEVFAEQFPVNVTSLMNEDQLWSCFYIFPEIYADVYRPTVRIMKKDMLQPAIRGVLVKDLVAACLTYLARTPILGDWVYTKLDLSGMHLQNIKVIQQYKYIVYLDLSSNDLTDLSVLSNLHYLQYLSASSNKLVNVLDYDTPQWFLTEVHYKFNSITHIRDISMFWSITILDLSHNNIKYITGLEKLMFLRRLDLSFNHIRRLENLNNLPLLWLDISYNNISSFEFGPKVGLRTLLHLQYININENNFESMKLFAGCSRLRELRARNNRLSSLLDLALFTRTLRRLAVIDLRGNPIHSSCCYKDFMFTSFSELLSLDDVVLDPIEKRSHIMYMSPKPIAVGLRRLLRLLYVEMLSRAKVSPHVPPADTADVPLVVIVGQEAVGKGTLTRRLDTECLSHVQRAVLHTTATHHCPGHYHQTTREQFDEMLISGELLTYSEIGGQSYGLSRAETTVSDNRVRVACMDLTGALMLRLRGMRPYLILASFANTSLLVRRQQQRKLDREKKRESVQNIHQDQSTLQMLLSGHTFITEILNDIVTGTVPLEEIEAWEKSSGPVESRKKSEVAVDDASDTAQDAGGDRRRSSESIKNIIMTEGISVMKYKKMSNVPKLKSVDFSKDPASSSKVQSMPESAKSVTFISPENSYIYEESQPDPTGLLIEPLVEREGRQKSSTRLQCSASSCAQHRKASCTFLDDNIDTWIDFFHDTGLLQTSDLDLGSNDTAKDVMSVNLEPEDQSGITKQLDSNEKEEASLNLTKESYEQIHIRNPGLFWDTVIMDNPGTAFKKVKDIIRNIVNSQRTLKPMFRIDFANMDHYPSTKLRLERIKHQIAPQRLFY